MSTPAQALTPSRVSRRQRRRRHALNRIPLPWHEVPVAASAAVGEQKPAGPRYWILGVVSATLIGLHVAGAWYAQKAALQPGVKPQKNTLAIELVRPPKPVKVEPPPPPPRKTPPKAPPPIQTESFVASEAPIAAPVETVAAVVAAEPAPPAPEPVKPAFGGIGYKNNPPPDYPSQAVRQGWQGTVLLRVRVLQSGSVESVEVVKSSGKKVLDDAAIATVQRWMFAPSTRGTTPVDGFATVPIEFKLDS